MKKTYKSLLGLALAVIMIFAACVPSFAAAKEEAMTNSSSDFITSIESKSQGEFQNGDTVKVTAVVKNGAKEPRDILVKVRTSRFGHVLTINGERDFDRNVTFKDVGSNETRSITVEIKLHRNKLPIGLIDNPINFMLGEFTMILFGFVDTLSLNLVTTRFIFDDSYASIAFKAEDVTAN